MYMGFLATRITKPQRPHDMNVDNWTTKRIILTKCTVELAVCDCGCLRNAVKGDQASSLEWSSPTCTKMSANGSKTTSLFLPRSFILPKGTRSKSWSNNPYFDLSYCLILWNVQQTPGRYPTYPKIQIWTDFLHKKVVEVLGYVPLYVGDVLECLFQSGFVVATSLVQAQHPRQPAPWTTSTPPEERWKPRGLPSCVWFIHGGVFVHLSAGLHHFCHADEILGWWKKLRCWRNLPKRLLIGFGLLVCCCRLNGTPTFGLRMGTIVAPWRQ